MKAFTVDFASHNKQVVAGGAEKFAMFLDAGTGEMTKRLKRQVEPVGYVELPGDGKLVGTACVNSSSTALAAPVSILETDSGRKCREWLPSSAVVAATWTADGHFLAATLTSECVHIWRVY